MIYLIISILASVSVSVLLKIARSKHIDIVQAVAVNYPVAVILSFILLKPDFSTIPMVSSWWLFGALGVLLPLVFIIMGRAVAQAGIVKSDAAQRLSLILTLMIAFFIWQEPMGKYKLLGIFLALIALAFLLYKPKQLGESSKTGSIYLLMVWLGYGSIDLLFKLISKTSGNDFSTTLTSAFIISAIVIFAYLLLKKKTINRASLLGGVVLGLLNFTNIYTYITAHKHLGDSPSVVFTGMNIGVIAVGTLVGLVVFRERLNKYNLVGIGLAVLAIIVLFVEMDF